MVVPFKFLSLAVFLVFAVFVFDIRNKPGMVPIVRPIWTTMMKLLSVAMFATYVAVLVGLEAVAPADWLALGLTAAGATLVAAAKLTLGRYHTWTGFHLDRTVIVRAGIYSRLRHPLYTGVFLFEFGGLLVVAPRVPARPAVLLAVVLVAVLYLMAFNVTMARRESREMARKFGAEFDDYRSRVRAFIPVRRSPGAAEGRL
jgi:protein-S-isoprenylcysteine O-methyltransferase Ste14